MSQEFSDETSQRLECLVVRAARTEPCTRDVIRERPLSIVVNGESAAVLMCTPGAEEDLALGFMLTEGFARSPEDVETISFRGEESGSTTSEVRVQLVGDGSRNVKGRYRDIFPSSGSDGAELIEAMTKDLAGFQMPSKRLRVEDVLRLRDRMEAAQVLFRQTGAAHAAAVAELPIAGTEGCAVVREDIGRHNALDKAVGAAVRLGLPRERALLLLSGRLSLEMVAKAARAGIGQVAGLSAPSAAGVALASELGMFLAGFVRGETMTVYCGAEAMATGRGS